MIRYLPTRLAIASLLTAFAAGFAVPNPTATDFQRVADARPEQDSEGHTSCAGGMEAVRIDFTPVAIKQEAKGNTGRTPIDATLDLDLTFDANRKTDHELRVVSEVYVSDQSGKIVVRDAVRASRFASSATDKRVPVTINVGVLEPGYYAATIAMAFEVEEGDVTSEERIVYFSKDKHRVDLLDRETWDRESGASVGQSIEYDESVEVQASGRDEEGETQEFREGVEE